MRRARPLRLNHATVVACLALLFAVGGGALAATGLVGSNGQIRGCVSGKGQLTLLKPAKNCKHGQTQIAWSQKGPPGAKGGKGDPGAPGGNSAHATTADSAANAGNADTLDNKNSSAFASPGSEAWHAAVLNDGAGPYCYWTRFSNEYGEPGYYRDPGGTVHLRGLARATVGSAASCGSRPEDQNIFSLPSGYRPEDTQVVYTLSNQKAGRIDVSKDGVVSIYLNAPTFTDAQQWVSLDGLSFRCGPSGQDGCP